MNEGRYRAAERALWDSVGARPAERAVDLRRTGTTVRIQEIGSGQPVVFVHGACTAGSSWASLVARLDRHRCLLVDRPGCGLSPPLGERLTDVAHLAAFADDFVVDVLEALDLDAASVVATSFGGYFGLRGAAVDPARVRRLFLLGWSFGAPLRSLPLVMRVAMQPTLGRLMTRLPLTERMARAMLRQVGLRHALASGRFGADEMAWFLSLLRDTRTMRNEIDAMPPVVTLRGVNVETLLDDDLLSRIEAPTHLLWGEDDPMGGADVARAFAARCPNAELEIMPGAGHAPWMDDAAHVARRLTDFLSACDS